MKEKTKKIWYIVLGGIFLGGAMLFIALSILAMVSGMH